MAGKSRKLKERAQAHLDNYEYSDALSLFESLVAEDPSDLASLSRVAELREGLGRNAEAVAAHEKIVEQYARDGFLLRAIAACKRILSLDAAHQKSQTRLAELYAAQKSAAPEPLSSMPKRPSALPPRQTTSISQLMRAGPGVGDDSGGFRLPSIPLFSELPRGAFIQLLEKMKLRELDVDEVVIKEGETGHSFFAISEGRVRVEKHREDKPPLVLAYLSDGAFFGEMALIDKGARTASVVSDSPVELFEIEASVLDEVVERFPGVRTVLNNFYTDRLLATMLAIHPLFDPFNPAERRALTRQFKRRRFEAGDVLIQQGQAGKGLYLCLSGRLEVSSEVEGAPVILAELRPGEVFGEMSLLSDSATSATVTALESSHVLRLGKAAFEAVVSSRPEVRDLLSKTAEARLGENASRISGRPVTRVRDDVLV